MKSVTVGWFEIPTNNMDRAIRFYEAVFEVKLVKQDLGGLQMAWFPWDHQGSGAGGSLVYHGVFYRPSQDGVLVYFSSEDITSELSRVEIAGGEVIQTKKQIAPDVGYMAVFLDTEGNRIALHSQE